MMKKFVFLYYGSEDKDQGSMDDWMKWFSGFGDKMVDGGNPFGHGTEVSKDGSKELSHGADAVTGYSIVNAKDMAEAVEMTKGCPVSVVRVYEAMPM